MSDAGPPADAAGRVHVTPVQVRFGDTDKFGHVNNANYATYVESARIELVTSLGHPLGGMILAHMALDFRRQLHVGDPLVVFTRVAGVGRSSIRLLQALVRPSDLSRGHGPAYASSLTDAPDGDRIADAATVVVAYDYGVDRSVPVPEALRRGLAPFTGPLPAP